MELRSNIYYFYLLTFSCLLDNSYSFYIHNSVGFYLYLHRLDRLLLNFVISIHTYVRFRDICFCCADDRNMIKVFKH